LFFSFSPLSGSYRRRTSAFSAAEIPLPSAPTWNETEEEAFWESKQMSTLGNNLFEPDNWRWEMTDESPFRVAEKAYRAFFALLTFFLF
jgi:hypothetical protein